MKSSRPWSGLALLTLLVSGLIFPGCTYDRARLAEGKTLSIDRVPSSPIYISWVYAEEKNDKMVIVGFLRSHFSYTQGTGHVDVAVISPGGELLGKASVDYDPKTIPPRSRGTKSRFSAVFPFIPPDGSMIRVALHHFAELEQGNPDCGNNLAAKENAI